VLHIVPRIRYLGFTLKGRRVPWLHGGLVRLRVQTKLDTQLHRQEAPFSGAVAGKEVIKIQSSLRL
jgi:hypothetical protein